MKFRSTNTQKALTVFGLVMLVFQVFTTVILIMGLIHAFSYSIILGFLAFVAAPATVVVEFVNWFSVRDLWKELSDLLNSLIN